MDQNIEPEQLECVIDPVDLNNCTREGLIEIINMLEQIIEEEDRPYHKT